MTPRRTAAGRRMGRKALGAAGMMQSCGGLVVRQTRRRAEDSEEEEARKTEGERWWLGRRDEWS